MGLIVKEKSVKNSKIIHTFTGSVMLMKDSSVNKKLSQIIEENIQKLTSFLNCAASFYI